MSVEEIESWKLTWAKETGEWRGDTLFGVLYCMEHRSPDYFDLEKLLEYGKLVEIGCEFIVECNEFEKGRELWERVQGDYKDFEKDSRRRSSPNSEMIKQIFERACRKVHVAVFEERLISD